MKKKILFLFFLLSFQKVFGQEALLSTKETFYHSLALKNIIDKPYLNYRTLNDSNWIITQDCFINNYLLSTNNVFQFYENKYQLKLFSPTLFSSYNTTVPYGKNDGALWQGKGFNSKIDFGVYFKMKYLEFTIKPNINYSQNLNFNYLSSFYDSKYGYFWGYSSSAGVDCPQRFGNTFFFTYDWGDSELRFTKNNLTIGFGTQSIFLGPSVNNSLLHSNNAPTYPKIDLGLKKTAIYIPQNNFYLGNIEGRLWVGYLTESKYFDNNPSNNHNQITGFTFSLTPFFLPELTIGLNKICLSKWNLDSLKYINPFYSKNNYKNGASGEDQKISITTEFFIPKGEIRVFGELGIDDKPNNKLQLESILTHFWHCATYTVGLEKIINTNNSNIFGLLSFEWNNTEMSQDMQFNWAYNFGFHNLITQGYTNKGQWLGMGNGYGGQSQYLSFNLFYPQGNTLFFLERVNPDNNYLFKEAIYDVSTGDTGALHKRTWNYFKTITSLGIQSSFKVQNFIISPEIVYSLITNPLYNELTMYTNWTNFHFSLNIQYEF